MKLHFFGNCQAAALREHVLEDHPDWSVSVTALGSEGDSTPEAVANQVAGLAEADVVVTQVVAPWADIQELSFAAVEALRKPGSQLLIFPSIVFEGTHPSFTYLGNRLDGLGMPYHNAHAVDMFLRGYRHGDIAQLLRSDGFYGAEFAQAGVQASLVELRYREALQNVTVKVSDLIEDACQSWVPMNAMNHPKRPILTRLLNRIYRILSLPPVARDDGVDYLRKPFIPPLPTILHHLRLPDTDPMFHLGSRRYTREEYLAASLSYYQRLLRGDLVAALLSSRAGQFLEAFGSSPAYPDRSHSESPAAESRDVSREWLEAAYAVFLSRLPGPGELVPQMQGLRESSAHFWLSCFVEKPEFKTRFRSLSGPDPAVDPVIGNGECGPSRRRADGLRGRGPLMDAASDTGRGKVSAVQDMFDDGWCGPCAEFTVRARDAVATMEFTVWTRADMDAGSSRLTISVGGRAPFALDLPIGRLVRVQVACPLAAGDAARVRIGSEFVLADAGEDHRRLSFVMQELSFR